MLTLKDGIHSVGVLNPTLRKFDIIMDTEYGTTYNAYLIEDEQPTLIETVHENFFDSYLKKISNICKVEDIKYIIFDHTEPDHSGSLHKLLDINPEITVVGSMPAIKNLQEIVNRPFNSLVAKDGDTLNIGKRTLKFISAPNLHWPDSMFTYSEADKAVFTCDFLGAHYCEETILDTDIKYEDRYFCSFAGYYDAIFSPFKKFVLAGLQKLEPLSVDMVLTSHGPVLTEKIEKAKEYYRLWSTPEVKTKKTAVIAYVSAYGFTKKLAAAAEKFLEDAGYLVKSLDLERQCPDYEAAMNADLLLFGSPTINRDALKPVWDFISCLDAINLSGKACGVFGSFGWSGEAVPALCARLSALKLKVGGEGFRVKFCPSEKELEAFNQYLTSLI